MNENITYALIGAGVLFLLSRRASAAVPKPSDNPYEVPHWGSDWISNQWATVMQGQAAHSGQLRPGWHF